jgi:hypothetical protein
MAAASLVIGILGFILFCWLGPVLGGAWAAIAAAVWPIWTVGLVVGVAIPVIGIVMGSFGMKKEDSKGICLAGIVMASVAAVIGLILTIVFASTFRLVDEKLSDVSDQFDQAQQQLQQQLNDPALQQQIQQQLLKAQQQEPMEPMEPVDPAESEPDPEKPAPTEPEPTKSETDEPAAP